MHANSSANLSASTDLPHWGGMAPIDPTAELMSFAELPRWQRWLPTAWGEWYAQLVVPIWMRFVLLAIFCGICCISDMIPLALSGLCLYGAYGAVWFLWRRLYVVKRGFIWLVGLPELLLSERVVCVLLLYVLLISQLNLECQGVVRREHGHDVRYPLLYRASSPPLSRLISGTELSTRFVWVGVSHVFGFICALECLRVSHRESAIRGSS